MYKRNVSMELLKLVYELFTDVRNANKMTAPKENHNDTFNSVFMKANRPFLFIVTFDASRREEKLRELAVLVRKVQRNLKRW